MSGLAGQNHSRTDPATEARAGSAADILNPANLVTLARLCAVPVAVILAVRHHLVATFVVFGLAGVSDAVDGWLARRHGGTALGATLDPLADKALLVSMFVVLAAIGVLPVWLAVLAVTRDALIVGGLVVCWGRGIAVRMRPLTISKVNTALQLLLITVALLLHGFALPGQGVLQAMVWVVAGSTVLSAAAYVRMVAR